MRTFPVFAVACAAIGSLSSVCAAADIPSCTETLVIAAESETSWTVTCGTATTPLVTFDPVKLKEFKLTGETSGVVLVPPTAPQPTAVTIPLNATVEFKALKSSTLTKLSIMGPVFVKPTKAVEFAVNAFAGLTTLTLLDIGLLNVSESATPWLLPASLNKINFRSVGMDHFEAKVEGGSLNLTELSFSSVSGLKELPGVIFNTPLMQFVSLYSTSFPPLTLSRKRFDRLTKLLDKSLRTLSAADFVGDCTGGKKETITVSVASNKPVLVCVMPTGKDDDLVAVETSSPPPSTSSSSGPKTPSSTSAAGKETETPKPPMSAAEQKQLEKLLEKASGKSAAIGATSFGGWLVAGLVVAGLAM